MSNKYKSFLIINPFGIGDVLFSTPLIRNIKEKLSGIKIFYLCNRRAYPVLKNNPSISKCFIYERDEFEALRRKSTVAWIKRLFSLIAEIRREKIDIALDLSLNSQFGFLSWAAGIKQRIGYDYKKRGRFLTKKIAFNGYSDKHVVEYYLDLLRFIGIEPEYKKIELFLAQDQKQNVNNNNPIVLVIPGGGESWGRQASTKHWPREKFAKLADQLINDLKVEVILSGSTQEKDIVDEVASLMSNQPLKAIGLELIDFLGLLNKAELLVANDGGPVHMAVALGIKTVSIFGPVSEVVYGPYPQEINKHMVIKSDLACRPCYKNFRLPECLYGGKCLKEIEVVKVYKAAMALIQ